MNNDINPFAPGDFAEKRVLKLVELCSGHCRANISRPSDPDVIY